MDGAGDECWQDESDGEMQVCENMGAVKVISFKTHLSVFLGGKKERKKKEGVGNKPLLCWVYFSMEFHVGGQRIQCHLPRALLLLIHICIGKCEGSKHISDTLKRESAFRKHRACAA